MTDLDKIPVLLVDDRQENLTALEALLEDMGLALYKALSGNEALRLSLKHDYAIVLMDVRMPDMDGYETAELMRANPKTSRLPIIFVTAAMKDTEHQFKGYESGAFDYLLKPVEPTILRSKIRVFCDLYQQRRRIEMHEQQLETLVGKRTAELKKTLDSLREREALLTEAQRIVHIGNWELNLETNTLTWSDEIFRIFGIDRKRFGASYEAFLEAVHPEDRDAVNAAYTQSLKTREPYGITHRLLMPDGRIKYVQEQCETSYSSDGKPLRSVGTVQDITERKQSEEKIHRLNEELEQKVRERTKELEQRNYELARLNNLFVGRELRMTELKERIKELERLRGNLKR